MRIMLIDGYFSKVKCKLNGHFREVDMKKGEELDVNLLPFMCNVPENAIELTITAKILNDDGTTNIAETKLKFSEVREGFVRGEEYDIDHGVFMLADEDQSRVMENEDDSN